jgi:hypothetical protein
MQCSDKKYSNKKQSNEGLPQIQLSNGESAKHSNLSENIDVGRLAKSS